MTWIEQVRERERKATTGPVYADCIDPDSFVIYRELDAKSAGPKAIQILWQSDWATEEDAAFYAHARTEIPRFLALHALWQEARAAVEWDSRDLCRMMCGGSREQGHADDCIWRRIDGMEVAT